MLIIHLFKLLRPKHWVKNLFVFAPLVFARELFDGNAIALSLRAFGAFCLTASVVYIFNDIADIEADRAHPKKKNRPLAAGAIQKSHAFFSAAILIGIVFFLTYGLTWQFKAILASYFIMNLAYSFKLKEVVLLDVLVIATGFMMRVLGGAYAIDVYVSTWLILCTLFLSLFLGFAKRRSEIVTHSSRGEISQRKVLSLYKVEYLDQMLTLAAAGAVISYALYTVAPRTIEIFGTEKMIYTTVFVVYGVLRYMYLIHMTDSTENPTGAVLSDPGTIINVGLWILSCVFLIYSGNS
ncbi:MAG TPA: decaprenyl-phosphate phosphoribosyltransferase [Bacteroidota bacterium]